MPALVLLLCTSAVITHSPPRQNYLWKNVQIVGAGFVDGVIFHPTAHNVRYARTDIGGAYRWDETADRWQPMLDWIPHSDMNLMGVESIAVDPADPGRVFLACGTYTASNSPDGAVLRSSDGGRTFERADLPFKIGGNEDGRGNGERLAVDPADGRILYLGSRHDGFWHSLDRGVTWSRVAGFPDVAETGSSARNLSGSAVGQHRHRAPARGDGVVFVKFAPSSGKISKSSATQTIFAGVSLMNRTNLFVTHDGGLTWNAIAGEPTQYRPTRAAFSSDGFLYISYGTSPGPSPMANGALWRLNTSTGIWTDITPDRPVPGTREFGYAAVSVDAQHPRTVIASTYGRPGGEEIFRSTDAGESWKAIVASGAQFDYSRAPYVKGTPIHWLFDIEIDPTDSNHAVFTTGYGGWETFDLTSADCGKPTHWRILAQGIEESVALDLQSPARGAHLISAIGDYGGFVHWNVDAPAAAGSSAPPKMSNTTGIESAALQPAIMVRVGISAAHEPGANISYSLDGGLTWGPTASSPEPGSRAGSIAVSSDGAAWIWTPEKERAYVTRDHGAHWSPAEGLPPALRVIADPVNARSFYAISLADHMLYRSVDGGASFTPQQITIGEESDAHCLSNRGDDRGGQDQIYAAPGRVGDLWLAAFDGLYRAASPLPAFDKASVAFKRLPGVDGIEAFGFGKAEPGHSQQALYLAGTVHGQPGIFRSTDEALTWTRINDDRHQWGLILQITGDPRIYGRVYVGTHGRGILYGDPARSPVSQP